MCYLARHELSDFRIWQPTRYYAGMEVAGEHLSPFAQGRFNCRICHSQALILAPNLHVLPEVLAQQHPIASSAVYQ